MKPWSTPSARAGLDREPQFADGPSLRDPWFAAAAGGPGPSDDCGGQQRNHPVRACRSRSRGKDAVHEDPDPGTCPRPSPPSARPSMIETLAGSLSVHCDARVVRSAIPSETLAIRRGGLPCNRSVPRHDGARWSASRSLACRAMRDSWRLEQDARRLKKGGATRRGCASATPSLRSGRALRPAAGRLVAPSEPGWRARPLIRW